MYIKDVSQKTNLEPHLGWFDFINCLKITGMSINDLRKIITMTVNGEEGFDSRRKILLDHNKVLEH